MAHILLFVFIVSGAGSTRSITPEGPIQEEPSADDYFGMNPKLKASGGVHYCTYCTYIFHGGFGHAWFSLTF